jgi:hypothetical protein
MGKIIRLTESDLNRIVKRVLNEQPVLPYQQPSDSPTTSLSSILTGKNFMSDGLSTNIAVCMGEKDLPQACKSLISKATGGDNKLSLNNIMGSIKDFGMCDKALGSEDKINKFSACLIKQLKK